MVNDWWLCHSVHSIPFTDAYGFLWISCLVCSFCVCLRQCIVNYNLLLFGCAEPNCFRSVGACVVCSLVGLTCTLHKIQNYSMLFKCVSAICEYIYIYAYIYAFTLHYLILRYELDGNVVQSSQTRWGRCAMLWTHILYNGFGWQVLITLLWLLIKYFAFCNVKIDHSLNIHTIQNYTHAQLSDFICICVYINVYMLTEYKHASYVNEINSF